MAMRLLTSTPGLLDDLVAPENVVSVLERSVEQAGGVKPPETQTAAYLLATLSQATWSPETLAAVADKYSCCAPLAGHTDIEHKSVLCCLLVVVEQLTQQLSVVSVSLLRAASSAPLYGLLFTAKLLLSQIDLRECKSEAWCEFISRLVGLSFSCSQAVASVVNNDSPEGHFPMDFDFDPAEGIGEDGVEGVTSQMVLLCSWRTVKEVSLLLGFLAEEASITGTSEDDGLLSGEDLLKIGDHLTNLLAETKHRGAFEQAYIGFCKLVSRLWKLPAGMLRSLPLQWLEETMQEISKNNENLCATRRSAGLPFMIQALICTQLEVEGASSIESWMSQLLDLAESATASPTTHTHALNILRALFRNTQLGEAVGVFVERAIIVTITAFSASSWMERNSATLLLSALMTRVFGVPRSKSQDHLSWKNKMTGRIFFQRYPKLFGFFPTRAEKSLFKVRQFAPIVVSCATCSRETVPFLT
ncbi:thyroid adenoma-associated protein homolog [Homalodisca vitripennis]|uniref:thyroid adenoma-associated protein homolog n=1 Tax=Homalodisca vitripennis TaxID=197043 RepID=UPI001EEA0243|nr:thyroid adenoma-associated protein homolog [Homalodisca vitripennis]